MERLKYKRPNYYVGEERVRPILVAGPIDFSYEFPNGQDPDAALEGALEKITGIAVKKCALERVPDAYLFKGISVIQPKEMVPDGILPARNMRHGSLFFFQTEAL
jgi:hypothetical protein